jgi:hypothetical protein
MDSDPPDNDRASAPRPLESNADSSTAERSPKPKDRWDKADIVGRLIQGVLLALVGILITVTADRARLQLSDRQQFGDYLKLIEEVADPQRRATLVESLDVAVPAHALELARHYAVSDQSFEVRRAAIHTLGRDRGLDGREQLERIAQSPQLPDRHLAMVELKRPIPDTWARVSEIDDIGHLSVNGAEVATVLFRNDSDWVDVTQHLKVGSNRVELVVENGSFGGWSGRLRISAGEQQYDSGVVAKENACPCEGPVFKVVVLVDVNQAFEVTKLTRSEPQFFSNESVNPRGSEVMRVRSPDGSVDAVVFKRLSPKSASVGYRVFLSSVSVPRAEGIEVARAYEPMHRERARGVNLRWASKEVLNVRYTRALWATLEKPQAEIAGQTRTVNLFGEDEGSKSSPTSSRPDSLSTVTREEAHRHIGAESRGRNP